MKTLQMDEYQHHNREDVMCPRGDVLFLGSALGQHSENADPVFLFDETIIGDSNGKESNNLSANGTKGQMDEDESSWGVLPFCPSKLAFSKVRQSYH